MDEIEHGRRAGKIGEHSGVARGGRDRIGRLHGHDGDLRGSHRRVVEQVLVQGVEMAVGVPARRQALVHLGDVRPRLRHVLRGQGPQHEPRRAAAASA